MQMLALIWSELVGSARGAGHHVTTAIVALASAGMVGLGIVIMNLWSPFTQITPTFPGRTDPANATSLTPIVGEFRGGVAFLVVLIWVLLVAGIVGPALTTGAIVRDRRSGRLDRILVDTGRADLVAVTKFIAAMVPLSFTLLTISPAASFAWLVGGLPLSEAAASVTVGFATILLIAAIGLFCAAVSGTEVAALVTSTVVVGVVILGPLFGSVALVALGLHPIANAVASADPLIAMLTAQPEFAAKLIKLFSSDLPTPPLTWTINRFVLAVWAVDVVAYVGIAVALVWLTSVVFEPLHPLKTWRLRQIQLDQQAT